MLLLGLVCYLANNQIFIHLIQGFLKKFLRQGFLILLASKLTKKSPNSRNRFSSVMSYLRFGNIIQGLKLAKIPVGWGFCFC